MADLTQWKLWARKLAWVRHVVDVIGNATWALSLIAGVTVVTAVLGFVYEHPSVAITLSVVTAYFAFGLFEKAQLWWRKESLDHKLTVKPLPIRIARKSATDADIFVEFLVTNEAGVDVAYVIEDETFAIGDRHAQSALPMTPTILRPGETEPLTSKCIVAVPLETHESASAKLSVKYGSSKKCMNIRLFCAFDVHLPRGIAKTGGSHQDNSYVTRRSDYEWVTD